MPARRIALLVLSLALLGCREEPGLTSHAADPPTTTIDETAAEPTAISWRTRIDRSWLPGCGTGEDLWKARDSSVIVCDDGIALRGLSDTIDWPVFFAAAEVDQLVIAGEGLEGFAFVLSWSGEGRHFTPDRTAVPTPTRAGIGDAEVRFDLAGIPLWSGEQRWLRLEWTRQVETPSRLHSVRAEKFTTSQTELIALISRPVKITLRGVAEMAYLALPGGGLEITHRARNLDQLALRYGLQAGARSPVTVRVVDLEPPTTTLYEDILSPAADLKESDWRQTTLDLSPWSGRTARIAILVDSAEPNDPTRGLPVLAQPFIVAADGREEFPSLKVRDIDWEERAKHQNQSRGESPARTLEVR